MTRRTDDRGGARTDDPLLTHRAALVSGTIVDRPNRFVLRVQFDGPPEPVHLGDPGVLPTLLAPGSDLLCSPVDDADRVTAYDAVAVRTGETVVGLRTTLANDLFERALARDALPWLRRPASVAREPALPDQGRTDFRLESADSDATYVGVKSCSLARDGVARFPDRSTERGRRQLRSLARLAAEGTECHVVFVVQPPTSRRSGRSRTSTRRSPTCSGASTRWVSTFAPSSRRSTRPTTTSRRWTSRST